MKKNYLTLFTLIICFAVSSYSQTAQNPLLSRSVFNDAKYLTDHPDNPTKRDSILAFYFKDNNEIRNLKKEYGTLNDFKGFENDPLQKELKTAMAPAFAEADRGLGALFSPTTAIDALGSVIAEHFKQEVNIAFLKKFKDELEKEPYMGLLFPESKDVLMTSDPYNYPVFMNALKEAFQVDTSNLLKNLPGVINSLKPNDPKFQALASFLQLLGSENISAAIVLAFNNLAINYPATGNEDVKKALCIMSFALNSVKKEGKGSSMFINTSDLGNFTKPTFVTDYITLLVKQNEDYLKVISPSGPENAQKIVSFVQDIAPVFISINEEAKYIAEQNKEHTLTSEMIIESYSKVLESVNKSILSYKSNIDPQLETKVFDEIYKYSESVIKITKFIDDKKYGLALVELTQYIGALQGNTDTERFSRFKKYTGFVANALAAENKEQLMDALNTSAQPVGSYRIKRNTTFNVSVNAFAGGFVGTDFGTHDATVYGFTAPVGIYMGFGNIWKKYSENPLKDVDGKSFGLFLSMVDVGAVTAFRLQDSDTEMADVTWDNVFAPGAYLSFGFGKCPLSLNLGGQMGPELTKVNPDGTPEFVKKEWYWRFSAVIDIPLYNLYSKQRSYIPRSKEAEDKEAAKEIETLEKIKAKKADREQRRLERKAKS